MSAPADPAPKVGALLWVEADWRGETSMPLAAEANLFVQWTIIVLMGLGALAAYFLPFLIAVRREHPSRLAILAVNVFVGWTLAGWVVALAWSLAAFTPKPIRPMSHEEL